jgi:SAM-dependent methyltransferase
MRRVRTVAGVAALVGSALVLTRVARGLHHGTGARHVDGGVVMGNAAGYDRMSRRLFGSFFGPIGADIARAAAPGARVLEVGCGPGQLSLLLAGQHGLDVTGVDLDPAMIEQARANADASDGADVDEPGRAPTFAVADAAALPFPDASFDVVVSTLSMHHWAEPTAGLAEIRRVLAPGGRALIWDLRSGAVPFHRNAPDPIRHVEGSGLRIEDVAPWQWPWRFTFAQRMDLRPS